MILAKAPTITILLPIADGKGVLRFPHSQGPYYGIFQVIDSSKTLSDQAIELARNFLGQGEPELRAITPVDPVLKSEGQVSSVLFLLKPMTTDLVADEKWPTMAEILRSLPPGKTRLSYMKALQVFAGASEAEVSVLEVDDEVRARLSEEPTP